MKDREHTLHSIKVPIMPCTTLVSRNRPFSTFIDRSFLPMIVLLLAGREDAEVFVERSFRPRYPSSSIDAEFRMSRLDSACTLIASCLRSL